MALERPPYFLHFLQPDEAMPTRGTTGDWGETNLWKAKQAGRRFNQQLDPDQLKWIEWYAAEKSVTWEEARAVARQQAAEADCRVERIFEAVRRGLSDGRAEPLPSRQRCSMYVFDASLDISAYSSAMSIDPNRTLVKIAPMEGARVHRVRMSLLGVVGKDDDTITAAAEQYWAGLTEPELDSEVLLSGPFDVPGVENRR
jgi:hypothetical protein